MKSHKIVKNKDKPTIIYLRIAEQILSKAFSFDSKNSIFREYVPVKTF